MRIRGRLTVADIRQLIQKIVSDPKIAASSNFASKVYHDEPILIAARQMETFTPPKIREMRKLARMGDFEAKVFYEQGRFMESFEDDFEYRGEFVQYFPTYQAMSDAQLRGYFSWRAKVRRGNVPRTSLSFAFVYIYELLNQIGAPTPEEGFRALKSFWSAYREIDSRIDSYAVVWLKDYVVYNNLDKSLLDGLADDAFDNAVVVLLDYKAYGADEVFAALNSLSSYDLEESKFFKLHPDEVRDVACRVFSAVSEYYNRSSGKSAREKLFGRICTNPYAMFRSAVFYHRAPRRSLVYEIGNGHRYICENGDWSCERFFWYGNSNKQIGALLKTVDCLMRRSRGYKSSLLPGKTNKILTGKIEKEIAKYEREKRENAPVKIDIDVSKLHTIRTAALATQNRLLVEEAEEAIPAAALDEETGGENGAGLSDVERRFVRSLLAGDAYDELLRPQGLMLSVLVDGINEKLFDMFNDTVVAWEGDRPDVIEDYREELKGMLAQ